MENAKLKPLYDEWRSAVAAHAAFFRDGKMSGLAPDEIDELGCAYVLRIDTAFARLKQAEAMQAISGDGISVSCLAEPGAYLLQLRQ